MRVSTGHGMPFAPHGFQQICGLNEKKQLSREIGRGVHMLISSSWVICRSHMMSLNLTCLCAWRCVGICGYIKSCDKDICFKGFLDLLMGLCMSVFCIVVYLDLDFF